MSRYNKYNEDGYRVIDGHIDPYVIRIDTGDGDVDYTANMLCDGIVEGKHLLPYNASLIRLAKTQGYTKKQLEDVLMGKETDSVFLKSVYDEVMNSTSDIRQLVFLVNLAFWTEVNTIEYDEDDEIYYDSYDAYEWFDYDNLYKSTIKSVTCDKTVVCGLVDSWNGGGSLLGIELEKDIEIPAKYIHDIESDYSPNYYPIWDIYGIDVSAFDTRPVIEWK